MSRDERNNALRRLLRAGDPAAETDGLAPAERAAMRARLLTATAGPRPTPWRWLAPAATAATLLALALGVASRQLPTAPQPASAAPAAAARQIQFTTENGTLVVWQLQPHEAS